MASVGKGASHQGKELSLIPGTLMTKEYSQTVPTFTHVLWCTCAYACVRILTMNKFNKIFYINYNHIKPDVLPLFNIQGLMTT